MTRLVPAREAERLAALRRLAVMETEPELQFDSICREACASFGVPITYIAFIDEGRQWLKAVCGMPPSSVPRDGTICSSTILFDRILLVNDTATDTRFSNNPYVLGPPYIRFYAGAPLEVAPGLRVGTLCLVDTVPRDFSPTHADALRDLAADVVVKLHDRAIQKLGGTKVAS